VRAGTTSTIAAVLVAACLTARGNPSLETLCRDRTEWIEAQVAERGGRVLEKIKSRFGSDAEPSGPGSTCAVIVSGDLIVGVDRDGYVTCRETSFDRDIAALTGFQVAPDSIGERLAMPELALGLAVVEAFEGSVDDMADLLSEVYVGDLANPRVVLCGGVTVEIGAGDYGRKIARLRQVLLQAPELGIRPTRVDMRFGSQVVVEYEKRSKQPRKEV